MVDEPTPHQLWGQATRETPLRPVVTFDARRGARYRQLMRRHGHLIESGERALPCGWSPNTR